jgi:hypothetical protein
MGLGFKDPKRYYADQTEKDIFIVSIYPFETLVHQIKESGE